ncbi:hypothetical protein LINPERHAP1_LOCUS27993, partial [Linum perenne]
CSSPIVAEARAILEAVSWASTTHSRCSILSDCLTLVSSLSGPKHRWPWECYETLGSISCLLDLYPLISISFTPRSLNVKADWVAKSTRLGTLPLDWISLL